MIYALGTLVGGLVVAGQLLWRSAVRASHLESFASLGSAEGLRFFVSPRLLAGTLLYVVAAGLYLYLQGRYDYHLVQVVVISSSLLLSFLAAVGILDEALLLEDFLGLVLLVAGVLLIGRR